MRDQAASEKPWKTMGMYYGKMCNLILKIYCKTHKRTELKIWAKYGNYGIQTTDK